ncbi:MAG TPA: hypothetical protein VFV39_11265 [Limnobacter sp.]|nr:hypothetical protein [Limnobacter sp.]
MFDLPKPGVYVVRAPQTGACASAVVEHWLNAQEETRFKACLWITGNTQGAVRDLLQTHLATRRAPKGLDVISVRALRGQAQVQGGVRSLCRSLDTLRVLEPALVVVEHADLWFNSTDMALEQRNPMDQMRLFHQWAEHANAHVLLPVEGDLPGWSVFADGLADVSDRLAFEFRPWWPTAYGLHSSLWNEPETQAQVDLHHVIHANTLPSMGALAQLCHALRFEQGGPCAIHVLGHGQVNTQDASVLLRMGADTVIAEGTDVSTWLGLPEKRLHSPGRWTDSHAQSPHFARDLHEVFMPGMLTVLSTPDFARQGWMLLKLARHWQVHCTLTRLSLMPHMTAKTALKLANWNASACVYTATREALYVIKLWPAPPDEQAYRTWMNNCFREPLGVLFSGDVLFEVGQQEALLGDLHEELEPLQVADLLDDALKEADLDALWGEGAGLDAAPRPWASRLNALLKGAT